MTPPWVKRAAVPADEDALVYLWLKSWAHSAYGIARGAHKDATQDERDYWADEAPLVEALLRNATVEVVCDPERADYSDGQRAVLWAFACTTGDVVHWVGVKRSAVKAGIGADVVRDLLGDRLDKACGYTRELVELRTGACGVRLPRAWYLDATYVGRSFVGSRRAA